MIKNLLLLPLIMLANAAFLSDVAYGQSNTSQNHGQVVVPDQTKERLKEIYEENIFSVNSFSGRWLPDGSGYLLLENLPGQETRPL